MKVKVEPSVEELQEAASEHDAAVIAVSVIADGETPLSLFARLEKREGGQFLFESVEGGERTGRWSFFGSGLVDALRFRARPQEGPPPRSAMDAVRSGLRDRSAFVASGLPPFTGGCVGFLGFDLLQQFERVPLAPGPDDDAAELLWVDQLYAYDHAFHRIYALGRISLRSELREELERVTADLERSLSVILEPLRLSPFSLELEPGANQLEVIPQQNRNQYEDAVRVAQQAIQDGEVFQLVLSQKFAVPVTVSPLSLYRVLRALNPSPYMFLLRRPSGPTLVGASPEVMVRVEARTDDQHRYGVHVRPIAGTRPRGRTLAQDLRFERELLADEKELAEHRMLLDLGRNDVGRVAKMGTVAVSAPLHIERYAHVMHMVSDVHGILADDKDACDAFEAGFPAGTVCGAPKLRAAELIAELEPSRRGVYAGAVGYFDHTGGMDTCIAIRTAVVHKDHVEVQAGAGIVADSVPEREYEECLNKARSPLLAIQIASTLGDSQAGESS